MRREFTGYRRESDRIGIRNHVAILPTSVAPSCVARDIAAKAGAWARVTPHQMGASQSDGARAQTKRVLVGIGRNLNVGAAFVVEFGAEDIDVADLVDRIARDDKPVETFSVHEVSGMTAAFQRGRTALSSPNEAAADARHESADVSEPAVGVKCGGSDATPGIATNPAAGDACDCLVVVGGTVSFSETSEFVGAEHVLAERCADEETRRQLLDHVEHREATVDLIGVDLRGAQPSPDNQEGGPTTIEEKSLEVISKGGATPVCGIVDCAERLPVGGGLVLMDTPDYDVESVVGKVVGGAQIIVFTTGCGSATDNPVAPVVEVTGNPRTWERMRLSMDVNAGTAAEGDAMISEAGERVFDEMLVVADGKRAGAETRRMEGSVITEVHSRKLAEVRDR